MYPIRTRAFVAAPTAERPQALAGALDLRPGRAGRFARLRERMAIRKRSCADADFDRFVARYGPFARYLPSAREAGAERPD